MVSTVDKPMYGIQYINFLCQSLESLLLERTLKSPIQRTKG